MLQWGFFNRIQQQHHDYENVPIDVVLEDNDNNDNGDFIINEPKADEADDSDININEPEADEPLPEPPFDGYVLPVQLEEDNQQEYVVREEQQEAIILKALTLPVLETAAANQWPCRNRFGLVQLHDKKQFCNEATATAALYATHLMGYRRDMSCRCKLRIWSSLHHHLIQFGVQEGNRKICIRRVVEKNRRFI
jgi:hypothetical protein